jgi:hypothetical protein
MPGREQRRAVRRRPISSMTFLRFLRRRLKAYGRRAQRCLLQGLWCSRLTCLMLLPVLVQELCSLLVFDKFSEKITVSTPFTEPEMLNRLRSKPFQSISMPPRPSKPSVAKRYQHSHSDHARMPTLLIVRSGIDKCAESGMARIMHKVYQIV